MILALLAGMLSILVMSSPVEAQNPLQKCLPIEEGKKYLFDSHGETLKFSGISHNNYVIMLFINEKTGTFSVGFILPEDRKNICPVDAGHGVTFKLKPRGDPA